jgi:uncharacterized repeat protein (TIGR01451 family)
VTIGSTVDYTFTIANTGGQSVSATLVDVLPAQVIQIESDSDHGSCGSSGQSITCWLGVIGAGQTATVTLATQVGQVGAFDDSATVTPASSGVTVVQSSPLHVVAAAATPVRFAVKQSKRSTRK